MSPEIFRRGYRRQDRDDISGTITFSNGHNVFGSDVAGQRPGDRENIAAGAIFAAVDPTTGGGKLGPDGTVALRNNLANPALSAGDPLAASAFDQRGAARPQPAGSLPDLGAVELNQPLSTGSTANNDVRTGTNAANNLTGVAGNDYLKGLGGNDTLDGGNGSDLLDGGPGNDKLTGGTGVDLVAYPGPAAVVIDLSGTNDTAKRGGETDTLIGIEGALGSSGNDTFKGDALANEFQGKAGKDTYDRRQQPRHLGLQRGGRQPGRRHARRGHRLRPRPGRARPRRHRRRQHRARQPELPLGRQGDADRGGAARLLHQRRHDHRARQHRCRRRGRGRDPAHGGEGADRGRFPAVAGGEIRRAGCGGPEGEDGSVAVLCDRTRTPDGIAARGSSVRAGMDPCTLLTATKARNVPGMSLEVESDDLTAFARRLITARKRIFKTRAALARASGIEADTIRTYENGRNYPHNQALKRLMVALGVTSDWLLYGETAGLSIDRLRLLEGERPMRTA